MVNEKNFVRLTQIKQRFGMPEGPPKMKVYPHGKDFLIQKMRMKLKGLPGAFWIDLIRKNEAVVEDRFGGKIRFLIEPVNGDEYESTGTKAS